MTEPLSNHCRIAIVYAVNDAREIHIKCVSPLIESKVAELPQYRDAGIIEKVVDTAELG